MTHSQNETIADLTRIIDEAAAVLLAAPDVVPDNFSLTKMRAVVAANTRAHAILTAWRDPPTVRQRAEGDAT